MAGDEEQHLSPEPQTTETTDVESGTAGYRNRKVLASQKRPATEVTTSSHDEANPGGTEGCDDADDDDDYEEDESGIVEIPLPGLEICAREREGDATAETPLATCRMGTKRCVPAFCAVCLSSYKPGNTIVWSSNRECSHVFHEECIQQWLFKLPQRDGPICPCCRRDFLVDPYDLLLAGIKADDADDEEETPALDSETNNASTRRTRNNHSNEEGLLPPVATDLEAGSGLNENETVDTIDL